MCSKNTKGLTPEPYHAIEDGWGHPLTWGRVCDSHMALERHVLHAVYDTDDEEDRLDDDTRMILHDHRFTCTSWPGPTCGSCWQSTCACGKRFSDATPIAARERRGLRGMCALCRDFTDPELWVPP